MYGIPELPYEGPQKKQNHEVMSSSALSNGNNSRHILQPSTTGDQIRRKENANTIKIHK